MPAGKGRRSLKRSAEADAAFTRRLWDAANVGLRLSDRLAGLRAQWAGQYEPLSPTPKVALAGRRFTWPWERRRDPVEARASEILADLQLVAQGRPEAQAGLAADRTEAARAAISAAVDRSDAAA